MYSSEFDEVRAPIVTEGLQLYVDPSKTECIQRNFNTRVTDLSSNLLNGTIVAGPGISGDFIVYNGSTQYITFGNNTANLDLSSKTFTAWIFPSAFTAINPIIGKWYASGGWAFQINTSGRLIFSIGGTDYVDTGPPLIANIWYFVAVTYDYANNIATFYKNGAVTSSVLNRAIIEASSSTELLQIGASRGTLTAPRLFFNGAIGPLYAYNRVLTRDEILTNFNVDKDRIIFFNTNLSGSIFLNGAQYLTVESTNGSAAFTFGSGNLTIECWVYHTSLSSAGAQNYYRTQGGGANAAYLFRYVTASAVIEWSIYNDIGTNIFTLYSSASPLIVNTWNHLVIVRNGTIHTIYVNGVAKGTTTASYTAPAPQSNILIGKGQNLDEYLFGYISNLRVVKGTAVYTSNFTFPSSSLTAIGGTSLLLNTSVFGNYLRDSSVNNFTLTTSGSPTFSTLTPLIIGFDLGSITHTVSLFYIFHLCLWTAIWG
jgi:hypothetical protein